MATRNWISPAILVAVLPLVAQDSGLTVKRTSSDDPAIRKSALLEGSMLNDQTMQPLKRGLVVLRPKGAGKPTVAETDDVGRFSLPSIEPGTYTIEARRDGYIPAQWGRRGGIRMPRMFPLLAGQEIKDLTFRLQPWGVIDGRVKFEDAEAAMGVPVQAYRKTYSRGRLTYLMTGAARTNDRGEYRIPGLAPGAYVVVAIYNRPLRPKREDDDPMSAPDSEMSYASTFFSSGHELTDAVPLTLRAGDEMRGIDIFLGSVKTLRVKMDVIDGCTGRPSPDASVQLFRLDASGYGSIPVNADIQGRGGAYVIRGLAAGSYQVMASSEPTGRNCPGTVRDRRVLQVGNYPIDDLTLNMQPPIPTRFSVSSDDAKVNVDAVDFHLEGRSGHAENVSVKTDRNFRTRLALLDPQEIYDLVVDRGLSDEYLAGPYQVQANNTSQVRIGARGALLIGVVQNDKREAVPGANVTLIPDPALNHAQLYGEAYANEQGQFVARGLAPGRYIAVPWLDSAPCDFYNWESLDGCRSVGVSVDLKAGDQKAVELTLKLEQ
jgi:hypothetical protein